MAPLSKLLLGVAALLASATSVVADPEPGTVGMRFEKKRLNAAEYPELVRRQSKTISSALDNDVLLYFINITAGTPPQPFSLQIDTGSSDVWFPSASICTRPSLCPLGSYNSSRSSTYRNITSLPQFRISYVDGTSIRGSYISDVMGVGGVTLQNATMASATLVSGTRYGIGIMGIGFDTGESLYALTGGRQTYPNVVTVMKNQGHISSRAYSLWLDDIDTDTGVILFGGVDTDKYHGQLVALPIQIDQYSGQVTSFTVAWTGLTVTGGGNNVNLSPSTPQPAILDSGTSLLYLPDDITNRIFNGVGALSDPNNGALVGCNLQSDDLVFSFTFGGSNGAVVNVTIEEFLIPAFYQNGSPAVFPSGPYKGQQVCRLAIAPAGSDPLLFGDSFLRSAYVVYDLDNNQIAIAQTNFDSTSQKIDIISNTIPDVARTASAATVAQTATAVPSRVGISSSIASAVTGTVTRTPTFNLVQASSTAGSPSSSGASSRSSSGTASGTASAAANSSKSASSSDLRSTWSLTTTSLLAGAAVVAGVIFGSGLILA